MHLCTSWQYWQLPMSEKLQIQRALDWAEASEASVMQMYSRGVDESNC